MSIRCCTNTINRRPAKASEFVRDNYVVLVDVFSETLVLLP
jgi:hypothetical protein